MWKVFVGELIVFSLRNSFSNGICQVGRYFLATSGFFPSNLLGWLLNPLPVGVGPNKYSLYYIKCILELIIEGTTVPRIIFPMIHG